MSFETVKQKSFAIKTEGRKIDPSSMIYWIIHCVLKNRQFSSDHVIDGHVMKCSSVCSKSWTHVIYHFFYYKVEKCGENFFGLSYIYGAYSDI